MADPAAMYQFALPPDLVLEVLVRLPQKEFHRCRCLSRAWAAALSSDDIIDRNLRLRGKIRVDYDDIMLMLVLECCIHGESSEMETMAAPGVCPYMPRHTQYILVQIFFY
jgi:hypothetical protein